MSKNLFIVGIAALLLTGCASAPKFDEQNYHQDVSPEQMVSNTGIEYSTSVLWGGIIVSTHNSAQGTQLEVLSYPLKFSQRPNIDSQPGGRFLVFSETFLEPLDYAPGKSVTIAGNVSEIKTGQVGESVYDFPLIRADQIHLWGKQTEIQPVFSIGVGFGF